MACGGKKTEEDFENEKIDDMIKKDAKQKTTTIKILLLGAGQTGKTTFMKQIQYLYADGFDVDKLRLYRRIIIGNVIDFAETLLDEMDRHNACVEETAPLKGALQKADRGAETCDKDLGEALIKFWKKANVQTFFKDSPNWLQSDACKYYFDKLSTITKSSYEPSNEDIFRCRVKTTGIYELKFQYQDAFKKKLTYILTDVGGQRSERNKWIHCFDNVMAVIFFVDLNGFNLTLDEAPTYNRMDESLKLFDSICNSQWFKSTYMILFFNKVDLFKEKLQAVRFADHFPGYYGDESFDSTSSFLKQKFLSLNKYANKPIYVHYTCATDTKMMKFVFSTVADVIIRNSLKSIGLL